MRLRNPGGDLGAIAAAIILIVGQASEGRAAFTYDFSLGAGTVVNDNLYLDPETGGEGQRTPVQETMYTVVPALDWDWVGQHDHLRGEYRGEYWQFTGDEELDPRWTHNLTADLGWRRWAPFFLEIRETLDRGPSAQGRDVEAVIDYTYTNTLSTAAAARYALSSLDTYMAKLQKNDITKFNDYVKEQLHELAACGQTTNDLVMNLFKGYFKCRDKHFNRWLERIRDDYITRVIEINPNGLDFMERVENYYKDRVRTGEWLKLDEDQETILALKAQLNKETKENKDGSKKKKGKKGEKGEKKRGKKGNKENDEPYEKPAWKKQAPKDGEPKKKEVEGKTYHWCTGHKEWTIHTSAECRKNKKKREEAGKEGSEKKGDGKGKKQLTLKVLQTIAEHIEDQDSESCCSP